MSRRNGFKLVMGLVLSTLMVGSLVSMGAAGPLSKRGEKVRIGAHVAAPPLPHSAKHEHQRPGSVIGADTPQLIPDDVAIGLLFRTIAHLSQQSGQKGEALQRFVSHIERTSDIRFTEQERLALLAAANQYAEQTAQPDAFRSLRASAAIGGWDALQVSVSPAVSKGLRRFLDLNVKHNIKILK